MSIDVRFLKSHKPYKQLWFAVPIILIVSHSAKLSLVLQGRLSYHCCISVQAYFSSLHEAVNLRLIDAVSAVLERT